MTQENNSIKMSLKMTLLQMGNTGDYSKMKMNIAMTTNVSDCNQQIISKKDISMMPR